MHDAAGWLQISKRTVQRVPTGIYVIALAFLASWIGHFALRTYGTYELLTYEYDQAELKLDTIQSRDGHRVRRAFGQEVADAERLLGMSQCWRAVKTEWDVSYICGRQTCWSLLTGDMRLGTLVIYVLLACIIGAMARYTASEVLGYFALSSRIPAPLPIRAQHVLQEVPTVSFAVAEKDY